MKCIFSIAPMESLEKSPIGTRRCACASGVLSTFGSVRVEHQMLCTGCGLDPVCASGVA